MNSAFSEITQNIRAVWVILSQNHREPLKTLGWIPALILAIQYHFSRVSFSSGLDRKKASHVVIHRGRSAAAECATRCIP